MTAAGDAECGVYSSSRRARWVFSSVQAAGVDRLLPPSPRYAGVEESGGGGSAQLRRPLPGHGSALPCPPGTALPVEVGEAPGAAPLAS